MEKTTVYLPTELKDALTAAAKRRQISEAELIREGIALVTATPKPPRPTIPLFDSGRSDLAERFDELLEGFGEN